MRLDFTKMNGAGNDFVLLDNRRLELALTPPQIAHLCDRHRGVGADGVLLVEPATNGADFRMRYFNADGSEAEMCGNGARCFAQFASRFLPKGRKSTTVETLAGIIEASFLPDGRVQLRMSDPVDYAAAFDLDLSNGRAHRVHFIDTGVPHAVVFVDDVEPVDVCADGRELRLHPRFAPRGTNVNFVQALTPDRIKIRTYERGVEDETLACGTGVVAAALIHAIENNAPAPVAVTVRGGDVLSVGFDRSPAPGGFRNVTLTGPADFVFDGQVLL
jgi:diaminopimelate epimerase